MINPRTTLKKKKGVIEKQNLFSAKYLLTQAKDWTELPFSASEW